MKLKNLALLIGDFEHISLNIKTSKTIDHWEIDAKELKYKISHNIIDGNYNITSITTAQKTNRYTHAVYSIITLS